MERAFTEALTLHAQYQSSFGLEWIRATDEGQLLETVTRSIETIRYSYLTLRQMGVVPSELLGSTDRLLETLMNNWKGVSGARSVYREQIKAGGIASTGATQTDAGRRASEAYLERLSDFGLKLDSVRQAITRIHAVSARTP